MRTINDYRCHDCGIAQEHFVENGTETVTCQSCSGVATKIISPVQFTLEGVSGSFPGAHMKWDKRRQEKMKQERAQGITPFGQSDH